MFTNHAVVYTVYLFVLILSWFVQFVLVCPHLSWLALLSWADTDRWPVLEQKTLEPGCHKNWPDILMVYCLVYRCSLISLMVLEALGQHQQLPWNHRKREHDLSCSDLPLGSGRHPHGSRWFLIAPFFCHSGPHPIFPYWVLNSVHCHLYTLLYNQDSLQF